MKALLRYDAKDGINKNIGDYIQSVAAKQFMGEDVILLERENLNNYEGDKAKLIMNGWWMHYPENFPPSPKIEPLFISFHINPFVAAKLLNKKTIDYLKKYEPIGCRDYGTVGILESVGVKSYFSGCLTLTLGNTFHYSGEREDYYFIDPFYPLKGKSLFKLENFCKIFFQLLINIRYIGVIMKITQKMFNNKKIHRFLRVVNFFHTYKRIFDVNILNQAHYLTHNVFEPSFKNERDKFTYTEDLLKRYSKAKLLVTSRLHAALPSLSMGTNTIFVNDSFYQSDINQMSPGRFEGLLEHINVINLKNDKIYLNNCILKKKVGKYFMPSNKSTFKEIAQDLTKKCEEFVKESV